MEKLVFVIYTGDECTFSCENTIPFEYESKAKFIEDLLLIKEDKNKYKITSTPGVYLEGLGVEDIQEIIDNTYTLNEWFEQYKQVVL